MTTSEAIKSAGPAGATTSAAPAVGEAFVSPDPASTLPSKPNPDKTLQIITILGTKGGIGKTTLGANLGAALADMDQRVLLVDADPQGSLTKYYPLRQEARNGLYAAMRRGAVTEDCISETSVRNLSLLKIEPRVWATMIEAERQRYPRPALRTANSVRQPWLAALPGTARRQLLSHQIDPIRTHAALELARQHHGHRQGEQHRLRPVVRCARVALACHGRWRPLRWGKSVASAPLLSA